MGLANFWDRHGVPRLIRCACAAAPMMKRRAALVPQARGRVLELGCGGGLNIAFYDAAAVEHYAGIDPNPALRSDSERAARARGWSADIRDGRAEALPFADGAFDTVVTTFTLCSVQDRDAAVREIARVLAPGGRALFLEHGAAPDRSVARWQRRIEPVWKPLAGGCHLTRAITAPFERAGFAVERAGQGYAPKTPRFAGWMEWGVARPA